MEETQVTVYTCSDGEKFDNAAEATAHEAKVNSIEGIVKYLDHFEVVNPKTRTRIMNCIKGWEAYKAEQDLVEVGNK